MAAGSEVWPWSSGFYRLCVAQISPAFSGLLLPSKYTYIRVLHVPSFNPASFLNASSRATFCCFISSSPKLISTTNPNPSKLNTKWKSQRICISYEHINFSSWIMCSYLVWSLIHTRLLDGTHYLLNFFWLHMISSSTHLFIFWTHESVGLTAIKMTWGKKMCRWWELYFHPEGFANIQWILKKKKKSVCKSGSTSILLLKLIILKRSHKTT